MTIQEELEQELAGVRQELLSVKRTPEYIRLEGVRWFEELIGQYPGGQCKVDVYAHNPCATQGIDAPTLYSVQCTIYEPHTSSIGYKTTITLNEEQFSALDKYAARYTGNDVSLRETARDRIQHAAKTMSLGAQQQKQAIPFKLYQPLKIQKLSNPYTPSQSFPNLPTSSNILGVLSLRDLATTAL